MRLISFLMIALTSTLFACGNPGMGCGQKAMACSDTDLKEGCGCEAASIPLLETLTYALGELGLADNSDVRTAINFYKKEIRSIKARIDTEAFENGRFNAVVYARHASSTQVLHAQIDLFDTLYLILNDEQKQKFPQLMAMYQHHMEFATLPKICTGPFAKDGNCKGKMGKKCNTPFQQMPMKKIENAPKR